MKNKVSLQDQFAANSICFGCGPANKNGLRIKSQVVGDKVISSWSAKKDYEAFPGLLNGGIMASLLDCHSNWAAAWFLMQKHGLKKPAASVTATFNIQYLAPTPTDHPILLEAWALEIKNKSAKIKSELKSNSQVTAIFEGVFVMVSEGHPAFGCWD